MPNVATVVGGPVAHRPATALPSSVPTITLAPSADRPSAVTGVRPHCRTTGDGTAGPVIRTAPSAYPIATTRPSASAAAVFTSPVRTSSCTSP